MYVLYYDVLRITERCRTKDEVVELLEEGKVTPFHTIQTFPVKYDYRLDEQYTHDSYGNNVLVYKERDYYVGEDFSEVELELFCNYDKIDIYHGYILFYDEGYIVVQREKIIEVGDNDCLYYCLQGKSIPLKRGIKVPFEVYLDIHYQLKDVFDFYRIYWRVKEDGVVEVVGLIWGCEKIAKRE